MTRILVTLALALAATAPSTGTAASHDTVIQPGAKIFSPIGQCTMNFVFTDAAGELYVGTAGHCVREGQRVSSEAGPFGTAVYSIRTTARDFALILIDEDRVDGVNPRMRVWGGPTGVSHAVDTLPGEPVQLYGYGIGFGARAETRPRMGPMSTDSVTRFRAYVPAIFGDSGSPVLHATTGKALGVATELAFGTGFVEGPAIEGILADLDAAGWDVELVHGDWEPPLPSP